MIFKKTKEAYNIRSKLVHSAKNEIANKKYLPFVHSLVCELGIMILLSNFKQEEIFKKSVEIGYGQKKLLINNSSFKSYKCLLGNYVNFRMLK